MLHRDRRSRGAYLYVSSGHINNRLWRQRWSHTGGANQFIQAARRLEAREPNDVYRLLHCVQYVTGLLHPAAGSNTLNRAFVTKRLIRDGDMALAG